MANQERPGTPPGTPEIDDPGTPHPSRKDREIQSPQPRTTPVENPKNPARDPERRTSTDRTGNH